MELAVRSHSRSQQLSELYEQLSSRYSSLLSQYDAQEQTVVEYKNRANYWEAQFQRVKTREEELTAKVEKLEANLRKREQQLFGKSCEKSVKELDRNPNSPEKKLPKKRGQQPGSKGHGRRDYQHLPAVEEVIGLSPKHSRCSCCGLPYEELPGRETSEVLEVINVKAHRRLIHRKRYKRQCSCKSNPDPKILLAPTAERLLPKSKLGISIWAFLLIQKYEYQHPHYRTLEQLSHHDLDLSLGTVTDGMKKLVPFFMPVYAAIAGKSIAAKHWHADETGWKVFEKLGEKENHRWFLWIFHNKETVVFKISPHRSSKVLIEYFGEDHPGGMMNVDRFSAYKVIAKSGLFILAFCWAHVRRDFLEHAKAYPQQEGWALLWVEKIATLYHINNQRIEHDPKSKQFRQHDSKLRLTIKSMKEDLKRQRLDKAILPSAQKLLLSLEEHWDGLTVFMDYPDIPMDNNTAERGLRSSVLGRKNYYGSGAIWSSQLAAMMFTLFKTLKLWKVNPHTWLLAYLQECAAWGSQPPDHIEKFLPWAMTPELRNLFSKPPQHEYSEESAA